MTYKDMVPLTELARQYFEEAPGYIIQSCMRNRNILEFLRQWENDITERFDNKNWFIRGMQHHLLFHYLWEFERPMLLEYV